MTGHSRHHEELLPAYALGLLDGEELREIEEHLAAGCAECRRQLGLWQGDLEELAVSFPPASPSPEIRRRILHLAAASRRLRRLRPRWLLPAAALLALGVWSGWRQARLGEEAERLRAERDLLVREVVLLERELGAARTLVRREAETLAILAAPGSQSVRLAGLAPTSGASGHAFVDPGRGRAVFYAFHLPPLAVGKTYELWWIAGGRPAPAGTFDVDDAGNARLQVDRVETGRGIQAWAVTVEPRGGMLQPTGEMVLKG